jgi:hypothetical protein
VKTPRELLNAVRALPLGLRWLLTIAVYAAVIAVVVVAVRGGGGSGASKLSPAEAKAESEANSEGRVAIAQDEAPHAATLPAGVPTLGALERAIAGDVHRRIAHNELTGPFESVRCHAESSARAGRQAFTCTVRSGGLEYPFDAVADGRTRQLTWCKVDPPPEANAPLEVPVSARCRA